MGTHASAEIFYGVAWPSEELPEKWAKEQQARWDADNYDGDDEDVSERLEELLKELGLDALLEVDSHGSLVYDYAAYAIYVKGTATHVGCGEVERLPAPMQPVSEEAAAGRLPCEPPPVRLPGLHDPDGCGSRGQGDVRRVGAARAAGGADVRWIAWVRLRSAGRQRSQVPVLPCPPPAPPAPERWSTTASVVYDDDGMPEGVQIVEYRRRGRHLDIRFTPRRRP